VRVGDQGFIDRKSVTLSIKNECQREPGSKPFASGTILTDEERGGTKKKKEDGST